MSDQVQPAPRMPSALPPLRRRRAGFSLLELVVAIAIVAILGGVLLERVMFYRVQAERVAMEQVAGNLRSALHLQLALLLVRNREQQIQELLQQNPMDWLAEKPSNYLGEVEAIEGAPLEKGHWYFERKGMRLLYLAKADLRKEKQKTENGPDQNGKEAGNRVYLKIALVRARAIDVRDARGVRPGQVEGVVLEQRGPE